MMLQVYKQRSVALTFAPSPLIYSQDAYMSRGGEWALAHKAQDRRTTTFHGQSQAQPCSSLAPHCLSDDPQEILHGKCPLSMGSHKIRKWFEPPFFAGSSAENSETFVPGAEGDTSRPPEGSVLGERV